MDSSAQNVSMETCTTQEEWSQQGQYHSRSSASHVISRENGMSDSHNDKLKAALVWLGARYLCAAPQRRRVQLVRR